MQAGELPPCPPVFIVVGDNEYFRDEICTYLHLVVNLTIVHFASEFARNSGRVRLQNYRSMPHVFQIVENHPSANTSFQEYAKFINEVTRGKMIEME